MSDLGTGQSSYSGSIDTNSTPQTGADNTTKDSVNGACRAMRNIQKALGINPQQNLATLKAYLQVEHDAYGRKAYPTPVAFRLDNIAASLTNYAIPVKMGVTTVPSFTAPTGGHIVAVGFCANTPVTAGTLTGKVTLDSVAQDNPLLTVGATDQYVYATTGASTTAFSVQDLIGFQITTSAGWLPVTLDAVIYVFISLE